MEIEQHHDHHKVWIIISGILGVLVIILGLLLFFSSVEPNIANENKIAFEENSEVNFPEDIETEQKSRHGQFEGIGANAEREEESEDEEMELDAIQTAALFSKFEECTDCTIKGVSIGEHIEYKYYGDLWSTAWADNDNLYMMFGDGTGRLGCLPTVDGINPGEGFDPWPGVTKRNGCFEISSFGENDDPWPCGSFDCSLCYENLCKATPAGVVELKGSPDNFDSCSGEEQCLVSIDAPYGDERVLMGLDKPSSMIAIGSRIYAAMHWPPGIVDEGYIAYSDDYARTWTKVEGTPWGEQSNFRVLMFIQMGKANELFKDEYVYALGMQHEVAGNIEQDIRLTRVPFNKVTDYNSYEYLSGYSNEGNPVWSKSQNEAIVLEKIKTAGQGSAMYHPGTGKYLFLSGFRSVELDENNDPFGAGALFEADEPWGPWREVARFPMVTQPSFIQKGATKDSIFFNGSGGTFFNGLAVAEMKFDL